MKVIKNSKLIGTFLFLLPVLIFVITGCSQTAYQPLTLDNLYGKRVGVINSYSSDYILSESKYNLDIYRFDMYADMEMALRFHRLDAAAMENDEAYVFCRLMPMFKIALVPERDLEFGYPFYAENPELLGQFNSFVKEFRKTPEYADIVKRVEATVETPYQPVKVENIVTTDRVLRVCAFDGWEPVSYINTTTDEWEGSDVELATYFANSLGAKLDLVAMSYGQALIELSQGLIDFILCPETLLYEEDMKMGSNATMSEGIFIKSIVLLENREGP